MGRNLTAAASGGEPPGSRSSASVASSLFRHGVAASRRRCLFLHRPQPQRHTDVPTHKDVQMKMEYVNPS